MALFVALLRGINVGKAKQVPMGQLVQVFENLGARAVSTVLRSGNVVFSADAAPGRDAIEAELARVTGVSASVLVIPSADFAQIADANPLASVASNGSRLFVTFLSEPAPAVELPDAASLAPEQIALSPRAVYQWFPDGSLQTRVPRAFWSAFGGILTARNANTVDRIVELLGKQQENT